jgi:hypothetical protein
MTTETPAATLKRLTSDAPIPCNFFAPEGEQHFLHRISWIDQMVLDALMQDFIASAKDRQLSDIAYKAFVSQVLAIGTIQMSLRKGAEASAVPVFSSLESAAAELRVKPQQLWDAFSLYAQSFEVTDTEKKS